MVTFKAEASANGEYLYIYKYVETTDDGCVYNAIVDGKIVEGLKSNDSTQVPNGVYEYTVDADGCMTLETRPIRPQPVMSPRRPATASSSMATARSILSPAPPTSPTLMVPMSAFRAPSPRMITLSCLRRERQRL